MQQHLCVYSGPRQPFGAWKQRQQLLQEAELLLDTCSALERGFTMRKANRLRPSTAAAAVNPWCLPLWSDPDQLPCTTSTPVQEEPLLFVQRPRILNQSKNSSNILQPSLYEMKEAAKLPFHKTSWSLDLSVDFVMQLQKFGSILWQIQKWKNGLTLFGKVWFYVRCCNCVFKLLECVNTETSILAFISFHQISLANSSHINMWICT